MASRKPKTTASASKNAACTARNPEPAGPSAKESERSSIPRANPPRRNLPALIGSVVFLLLWLIYLAYVAWRTVG